MLTSDAIAERIMEILPYKRWEDEHLVITGGEPLLGWQRAYPDLLNHLSMTGLKEITFETNGTQKLTPEFKKYLQEWSQNPPFTSREITFSVLYSSPPSEVPIDCVASPHRCSPVPLLRKEWFLSLEGLATNTL